jgi:type IV secretion system protein VirB10
MTENADQMAPDASPGEVSKKAGVRRVNNMPMYILGGVLLSFVLVMALVAADRAAKQNAPADGPKEKAGNTSMFAKEIAGDKTGGLIEPASPLKVPDMPTGPASAPLEIARPSTRTRRRPPANPGNPGQPVNDDEAQRIRMAKMQMFGEAVKAKTTVRVDAPRSNGSAPGGPSTYTGTPQTRDEMLNRIAAVQQQIDAQRSNDPTAAYQARLAQIRGMGVGGGGAAPAAGGMGAGGAPQLLQTSTSGGGRNSMAQFGQGGQGDRWKLDSQPEAPRTPFELRAGFVVPATLISGINSDLPGQIMAQVAQDVYDTPTGKHLLIPQGSRLVGSYSSDVAYGQRACWLRGSASCSPMARRWTLARCRARTARVRGLQRPGEQPLCAPVRLGLPHVRRDSRHHLQPTPEPGHKHLWRTERQQCPKRSPRPAARPGYGATHRQEPEHFADAGNSAGLSLQRRGHEGHDVFQAVPFLRLLTP